MSSAATMSAADAVKTNAGGASKQQPLKSSGGGKALEGARKQAASPTEGQNRKQQQPQPQPKAWQGTNPITQRASAANVPNGTTGSEKPLPKTPAVSQSQQAQQPKGTAAETNGDKHAHDRLLFILANFTGLDATLTMKNGEQFTGVFSGGSFESTAKHQYILKMVKRTRLPSQQQMNGATELPHEYVGEGDDHVMVFDKDDTVDLAVTDVVTANAAPLQNGSLTSSFRTDAEISGRDPSMPRERELQRWDAGADSSIGLALEDSGDAGWDQFAANERMYGVQSDYDENIYTTAIDRNNPQYRQREATAARIAREIEGTAPANSHVTEERRRDAERADGLDEEEKYSGVRREPSAALSKRAAGAYVPPSRRPITGTPTVSGAPFDPAIISSQLAKPTASTAAADKAAESSKGVDGIVTEQKTAAVDPAPKDSVAVSPPTQTPRNTTEEHVRNVTHSFKQFANDEKLRIRQAQEQKRTNARAEKNVKLNDLKKFSENFKLKSRVPDDLVPILAKDREKQIEIQHKAEEAAKETEVREKERKEKVSPASSAASAVEQRNLQFAQHRARTSQILRQPIGSRPSPRQAVDSRPLQGPNSFVGRPLPPQPLPAGLRIPSGPSVPASDSSSGPLSPTSASRLNLNAKAFEFRPAASSFRPSTTSQSPVARGAEEERDKSADSAVAFFDKDRKPRDISDEKVKNTVHDMFNPLKRMAETEYPDEQKKSFVANGGIPQPYRTPPTWQHGEGMQNASYKDFFKPPTHHHHHHHHQHQQNLSQGPSPMQTPNPNAGVHGPQIPHHQQLPQHTSSQQRQPYMPPPHQQQQPPGPHHHHHHGGGHPQSFVDPRMQQQFGPNASSVQSSPRFPPAQVAFNAQMPGMPPFAGQQQGYPGMSPSMAYRQMNMGMNMNMGMGMGMGMGVGPPTGPMMMVPQQQQQQQQGHGQLPPMPQGYARGPQFQPQMMTGGAGAPMMQQQTSQQGTPQYMSASSYSPMPPHATPHMQHAAAAAAYQGSPRPHMMQHSASHQGYQPQPQPPPNMNMNMNMGMGMGVAPPPPFAPSPGQPHPYHLSQQRQYSHSAMTPRLGQVVLGQGQGPGGNMHGSPAAMGGGQGQGQGQGQGPGDEGK